MVKGAAAFRHCCLFNPPRVHQAPNDGGRERFLGSGRDRHGPGELVGGPDQVPHAERRHRGAFLLSLLPPFEAPCPFSSTPPP
eukprot:364053-Chlamydomonas_euryale.AAC.3